MEQGYLLLMRFGHYTGCHQIPERSFHIHGYQFPLCARCTGILIGAIFYALLHRYFVPTFLEALASCAVMLLDWLIQASGLRPSTNLRRFITGTLCGYGLLQIHILAIQKIIEIIGG